MYVAHVNLYTLSEDTQKNPEYCRESGRESLPFEGKISKGDPPTEDFHFGEHIPQFHIPHPCSTGFTRRITQTVRHTLLMIMLFCG